MTLKRVMLEMGAGNDLHGGNYTKAALRAVQDALHHSSLGFSRALSTDIETMHVHVIIGVQNPKAADAQLVRESLPHGQVSVEVKRGGLDVPDDFTGDVAVVASAAVIVSLDLP